MCEECERLKAENAALTIALGTEQTMHKAWRKRAEEAERQLARLPLAGDVEGLRPVSPKDVAEYERAITEAVPQITRDLQRRAALAEEARRRPMGPADRLMSVPQ